MPAEKEHVTQAQLNEQFIRELQTQNSAHGDWVVTVAFYAALHWVDASIARRANHQFRGHGDRSSFLTKASEFKPIYGDYEELYNLSRESRYECLPKKWTPDQVTRVLTKLESIKKHLATLPRAGK